MGGSVGIFGVSNGAHRIKSIFSEFSWPFQGSQRFHGAFQGSQRLHRSFQRIFMEL